MNVKELKALLKNYKDDIEVLISIDEEGNAFKELADKNPLDAFIVDDDDCAWNIEIDEEKCSGGKPCIVFSR